MCFPGCCERYDPEEELQDNWVEMQQAPIPRPAYQRDLDALQGYDPIRVRAKRILYQRDQQEWMAETGRVPHPFHGRGKPDHQKVEEKREFDEWRARKYADQEGQGSFKANSRHDTEGYRSRQPMRYKGGDAPGRRKHRPRRDHQADIGKGEGGNRDPYADEDEDEEEEDDDEAGAAVLRRLPQAHRGGRRRVRDELSRSRRDDF